MNRSEIARVFDDQRKLLGLTKVQVAEVTGVNISTITRIVNNPEYKGCQFETLIRLLDAVGLGMTIQEKEKHADIPNQ